MFVSGVLKLVDRSVLVTKQFIDVVLLVLKKDNGKHCIVVKKALIYFLVSGRNILLVSSLCRQNLNNYHYYYR